MRDDFYPWMSGETCDGVAYQLIERGGATSARSLPGVHAVVAT
jgi:hypothetical protein